jgi:hypothetical protein
MLTISARSSLLSINIAISSKEMEAEYITGTHASCIFNMRATWTQKRESVWNYFLWSGRNALCFELREIGFPELQSSVCTTFVWFAGEQNRQFSCIFIKFTLPEDFLVRSTHWNYYNKLFQYVWVMKVFISVQCSQMFCYQRNKLIIEIPLTS